MPGAKVEPFAPLMREQNVIWPAKIFSRGRFKPAAGAVQFAQKVERLICRHRQRINFTIVPLRDRDLRFQKMRPRQIERQSFVSRSNRFVAPMILRRFFANFATEDRQGVAMITIPTNDTARRVTTAEENSQRQCRGGPS